jgi:ABC-type nitrate/sulfonate/bicarbonate transport system ATPase subunit
MRIDAIHLDHWLSYETFAWEELDPHLNVIVGPNGVGKTNLFHAVEAVRDAEAACKTVVSTRAKRAGMRWTPQGLDALLPLRTVVLNGSFDAFWQGRSHALV